MLPADRFKMMASSDIQIELSDPDSPAAELTVEAQPEDTTLIERVQLTGVGLSRSLKLIPSPNASGSTTVFITANDPIVRP